MFHGLEEGVEPALFAQFVLDAHFFLGLADGLLPEHLLEVQFQNHLVTGHLVDFQDLFLVLYLLLRRLRKGLFDVVQRVHSEVGGDLLNSEEERGLFF